jgi:succinate dehydrogenase / fumarate reductase cytochrome b subunit
MDRVARPVSPFWVYRWQITNTLSIMHRGTGLVLSLGAVAFVWWLVAAAGGEESYARAAAVFSGAWFKVPLTIWAFCFFYHLCNGIRHLFWDMGYGFDRAQIQRSGWTVVVVSIVATLDYLAVAII